VSPGINGVVNVGNFFKCLETVYLREKHILIICSGTVKETTLGCRIPGKVGEFQYWEFPCQEKVYHKNMEIIVF